VPASIVFTKRQETKKVKQETEPSMGQLLYTISCLGYSSASIASVRQIIKRKHFYVTPLFAS
jgi:hypothetical protein